MRLIKNNAEFMGVRPACMALAFPRSTYYRQSKPISETGKRPRPAPARALSKNERKAVLDILHSDRFIDAAPAEIVATLLDEGAYYGSARTRYRILESEKEVKERRRQNRHPNYKKPELLATGPNQVWSWDITKLKGPAKWTYFYLYVIIDIYSRYVVGWMAAGQESARLAARLISESCERQGIEPGTLTLHADRGSPMKAALTAQLLANLGVTKSHSRPHVSDDNPFSEAQFKTLKYRPDFPDTFGCLQDARGFLGSFFDWYNNEHRHSGINMLTPYAAHYGRAETALKRRHAVMMDAYQANPERFVNGCPQIKELPGEVFINPPKQKKQADTSDANEY